MQPVDCFWLIFNMTDVIGSGRKHIKHLDYGPGLRQSQRRYFSESGTRRWCLSSSAGIYENKAVSSWETYVILYWDTQWNEWWKNVREEKIYINTIKIIKTCSFYYFAFVATAKWHYGERGLCSGKRSEDVPVGNRDSLVCLSGVEVRLRAARMFPMHGEWGICR